MRRRVVVTVGLLVAIAVLAWALSPREYRAAVQEFQLDADPRVIVLHASLEPGDQLIGVEAIETETTVTVIVRARDTSTSAFGSGDSYFVRLVLSRPLGDRTVIDGTDRPGLSGRPVPRAP